MAMFEEAELRGHLESLRDECYQNSKDKGFWDGPENDNIPTKIALLHSELSEVLEAFRKGNPPTDKMEEVGGKKVPLSILDGGNRRSMTSMEEEIADVFIRLCDLCGKLDIDLGQVTLAKMDYNSRREFMHGGKRI